MDQTKEENSFHLSTAKQSDLCTRNYYRFLRRHWTIFDFFFFSINMATSMDKSRLIATRALAKVEPEKYEEEVKELQEKEGDAFSKLKNFGNYQSETICIRLVDNFLCFIAEEIQECMLKNDELLKSNEMVRIEDVLKFSRRSDIVRFLVDRKMNELSYAGILKIVDFLESRTGISLVESDEELSLLTVAIELRNIYTHNRGKVNELFFRRIGGAKSLIDAELGKRVHADLDLIVDLSNNLFQIAQRFDRQVANKFRLRRKQYRTWYAINNPPPSASA